MLGVYKAALDSSDFSNHECPQSKHLKFLPDVLDPCLEQLSLLHPPGHGPSGFGEGITFFADFFLPLVDDPLSGFAVYSARGVARKHTHVRSPLF